MKTRQAGKGLAGAVVICEMWALAMALTSYVYKWSLNPFDNPNPVYSHTRNRDNIFHSFFP
jgi:hypothetical protein